MGLQPASQPARGAGPCFDGPEKQMGWQRLPILLHRVPSLLHTRFTVAWMHDNRHPFAYTLLIMYLTLNNHMVMEGKAIAASSTPLARLAYEREMINPQQLYCHGRMAGWASVKVILEPDMASR